LHQIILDIDVAIVTEENVYTGDADDAGEPNHDGDAVVDGEVATDLHNAVAARLGICGQCNKLFTAVSYALFIIC